MRQYLAIAPVSQSLLIEKAVGLEVGRDSKMGAAGRLGSKTRHI